MKFGKFYEHQFAAAGSDGAEQRLFQRARQVEIADRLGIDYAWEAEHHFREDIDLPRWGGGEKIFIAASRSARKRIVWATGIAC